MEVIILAGGLGTRLRSSIGNDIPKCMANVAGKPFLWHILMSLKRFDINNVVLSIGHLRHIIIEWIEENKKLFPFNIKYSIEEEALGTGGGIKLALTKCHTEDVIVVNGDTFFDIDLEYFIETHKLYTSVISLALKPMKNFIRYGRVLINNHSHIIDTFCEKQFCEHGLINGGIYAINKKKIIWPDNMKFSFERDILEKDVKKGYIYGFEFDKYFIDIGIPEDYKRANYELPLLLR